MVGRSDAVAAEIRCLVMLVFDSHEWRVGASANPSPAARTWARRTVAALNSHVGIHVASWTPLVRGWSGRKEPSWSTPVLSRNYGRGRRAPVPVIF